MPPHRPHPPCSARHLTAWSRWTGIESHLSQRDLHILDLVVEQATAMSSMMQCRGFQTRHTHTHSLHDIRSPHIKVLTFRPRLHDDLFVPFSRDACDPIFPFLSNITVGQAIMVAIFAIPKSRWVVRNWVAVGTAASFQGFLTFFNLLKPTLVLFHLVVMLLCSLFCHPSQ